MKPFAAEFMGTFWLVLGGCGSAVLAATFPQWGIGLLGVSLAFGLTVLTGAYAFGLAMQSGKFSIPGAFALAHNVATAGDVQPLIDRLADAGGTILRDGDAPPHGGYRGYVADPDDHAWEIAWNPAWPMTGGRAIRTA